jgi:hypothetical protein
MSGNNYDDTKDSGDLAAIENMCTTKISKILDQVEQRLTKYPDLLLEPIAPVRLMDTVVEQIERIETMNCPISPKLLAHIQKADTTADITFLFEILKMLESYYQEYWRPVLLLLQLQLTHCCIALNDTLNKIYEAMFAYFSFQCGRHPQQRASMIVYRLKSCQYLKQQLDLIRSSIFFISMVPTLIPKMQIVCDVYVASHFERRESFDQQFDSSARLFCSNFLRSALRRLKKTVMKTQNNFVIKVIESFPV